MKNFVVGDIQGCYKALRQVLKKAKFDPSTDKLWAVGDLVARGPDSLSTLAYCQDLGPHFDTVLGNHDLHLIAIAYGLRQAKPQDKLQKLIKHKDFSKTIDWLKSKPLAAKPAPKTLVTHAGLYPAWSIKKALTLSNEISDILQSERAGTFLSHMYGNVPDIWDEQLQGNDRHRFIVNAFTRMRYLRRDLSLEFESKSHPSSAPKDIAPWFMFDNTNITEKHTLLFGHWAALLGKLPKKYPCKAQIHALDSGYVWGNSLSVFCIESRKTFQHHA
ncbi:symmetrical bis(5'-nucleosyl)-tetraphosphatase [Glaciecola siphonariae]|uniref:bis(5'-nucleosyl)-tetraphosphatase (symmetrical) n=1 Tax=Glaciecola siphonariae TaxID=521012 RepID=A0ABV9M0M5_9ALTE